MIGTVCSSVSSDLNRPDPCSQGAIEVLFDLDVASGIVLGTQLMVETVSSVSIDVGKECLSM
jgi:hypothetical protein